MTNIEGISFFCMLDEQFGIYYTKSENVDELLKKRFDTLCDKLDFYTSKYNAQEVTLILARASNFA